MTNEEKEQMKKERLLEYARRIYFFEMDVVAAESVGDVDFRDTAMVEIEKLKKAYAAVEAM